MWHQHVFELYNGKALYGFLDNICADVCSMRCVFLLPCADKTLNVFYDGPIRMHVPGITFNNHNWPHIVQVLRLSFCLNMILIPLLNLMASSIAVVAWKNIGKYVFLVIILCSTLLPIYVVGKKV